jgi:L,D-peptidoglycan transpeptidase YkuD (ErfK/YbiS/YcfS/YnhG family)
MGNDTIKIINEEIILNDLRFFCVIGKNGLTNDKIEGDWKTPIGTFPIRKIYTRKDKVKDFKCFYNLIEINPKMGWCDDSNDINYNKEIQLPYNSNYEKLYRDDDLYNIIVVLGYNDNPIIKEKGSAIFLHVGDNIKYTKGCIAMKQNDLIQLLSSLKKETKIEIIY